jgi:hypothetical protein
MKKFTPGTVHALSTGLMTVTREVGGLARRSQVRVQQTGIPGRGRRAGFALASAVIRLMVRLFLMFRSALEVARVGQGPSGRLTARGGLVVMFGTCFAGLLVADWASWPELADAVFFMTSSLTAYYVRPGRLLPVMVSPPLLFFTAMTAEKLVFASGMLAALEGTLVMLADAAPWLFAGTALSVAIALIRGVRREVRVLVIGLRG